MNTKSNRFPDFVREASCLLLDIEGTTTSVDFVRKELYTYGASNVSNYIKDNWNSQAVQEVVKELLNQEKLVASTNNSLHETDSQEKEFTQEEIITCLKNWMNQGKKTLKLKELECLIWKNGYINGHLVGHIYPDVISTLKLWKSEGKKISIYSTGSIIAQCLLFKYSCHGDVEKYIDKKFDTSIGSKLDPTSYIKICQEIGKSPNEFVFFSDHPQELYAARQAGMHIVLIVRDLENPMFLQERSYLNTDYQIINSFTEVI